MTNKLSDKKDFKKIIADNLNRMMDASGKSRKTVCKDLGIKYTTFCDWANGKVYPRMNALEDLCIYFDVKIGDFFVDLTAKDSSLQEDRIMKYATKIAEPDLAILEGASDELVEKLVRSGVRFRHRSLEEYVAMSGNEMQVSGEMNWGQPVEGEIW